MEREVLCNVNTPRDEQIMIIYKDGTYVYSNWDIGQISKWKIENDALWVCHKDREWEICESTSVNDWNTYYRKIIEEIELALSIESMLK